MRLLSHLLFVFIDAYKKPVIDVHHPGEGRGVRRTLTDQKTMSYTIATPAVLISHLTLSNIAVEDGTRMGRGNLFTRILKTPLN